MRVVLINMPFASLAMPSLALTQLSAVMGEVGERVQTETLYLNLDFAHYIGDRSDYSHALTDAGFMTGFGDWFFRQVAFPGADDNSEAYLDRYYFDDDEVSHRLRRVIQTKREGVGAFLDDRIEEYGLAEADVVGFTALFSQTVASFAMAQRLKMVNPDLLTVIGGPACEGVMGQEFASKVPQIDYVFSGPGLVSFPEFVRRRLDGDPDPGSGIDGVFSESTPPGSVSQVGADLDVDSNVSLDYGPFLDKLEASCPDGEIKPCLLFETSRGCFWAERSVCTFCGLNGLRRQHRAMSPRNAAEQIRSLFKWVPRCTDFIAVDTILPQGYVQDVFSELKAPPGMRIMYEVRPDLKEEEIELLYDAGVVALQPGIEALSTATLKLMRKGTTAFRNIAFLKAAANYATHLDWNLLLFSPGEDVSTCEKYLHDLPRLMHLTPPNGAFPINFVRYSRYFESPGEHNLQLKPQDFYELTYPFSPESIRNIAQHFVDHNAVTEVQDASLAGVNEAVSLWRDRWLGRDGKPQARLCFLEDEQGRSVYDSRSGEEREYELSLQAASMLRLLEKPATIEGLAEALGDFSGLDAAREIAYLNSRGLVFEENGRYMSLVLE